MGAHNFVLAVLPHDGSLGEVEEVAFGLNSPLAVIDGRGTCFDVRHLFNVSNGWRLSAVKWAEEGEGIVAHLSETIGAHRRFETLGFEIELSSATLCDNLERPMLDLRVSVSGATVTIRDLRPFEIICLLVHVCDAKHC